MYGFAIFCEISKGTFDISHKILNPYTAKKWIWVSSIFACELRYLWIVTLYALVRRAPGQLKQSWGWRQVRNLQHISDVTWAPCLLKLPTTRLILQQFVQADNKGNINVLHYWPFVRVMHLWPVDSPHKLPTMRKAFACHDFIIAMLKCQLYLRFILLALLGLLSLTRFNFNHSIDKWLHPLYSGGKITYPIPNFNGATVEVKEWLRHFIPHYTGHVITYPCWD